MAGNYLWILDNGHGAETPGKRSPKFEDKSQLFEYEFNRKIIASLITKLKAAKYDYVQLVPEVDEDISLIERVSRANSIKSGKIKIFISIHGNAFGKGEKWTTPNGIETYYYRASMNGHKIASIFHKNIVAETGWNDRGLKTAAFFVIKYTNMPAILTENGFYTNKEECLKMMDDEWIDKIAEGHFKAIKYIEEHYNENNKDQ